MQTAGPRDELLLAYTVTVQHDWPGHRESSVAKFRPHTGRLS